MPAQGDLIKITTKEGEKQGILMPSTDKSVITIKLDDGYNYNIKKTQVKSTKLIKKALKQAPKAKKLINHKGLKNITILHTGGTIASKVDYKTGGVISKFTPQEVISMYPEIEEIVNLDARLVGNMWSEDMRFAHYNLLAKEIAKEVKKKKDGIIITHGTDTLAITAAALSFILEHVNIPVILVGSQRSSDRGSSDAGMNLIKASEFISKTKFVGVGICMHESSNDNNCVILPPCKTRKFHSSRRDAFQVVNSKPIARIGKTIEYLDNYVKSSLDRKLVVKPIKENLKIGLLKSHVNMHPAEIKAYESFNGLVLEGFGIGCHFPINQVDESTKPHNSIYRELKKLALKIPVVATTQCIKGRLNMNVYTTGRKLKEINILGDYTDMLAEVAHIKLAWLLSNEKKHLPELMSTNLRGEISERTSFEEKINRV
jgi:glutamyl-tRNA(Gln) amidotransferase subunit D